MPSTVAQDASAARVRPWQPWVWIAALYALGTWFGTLGLRALFTPDEGRYAEIPREMLASGDWITPHLNGLHYFEKPPLQYWLTAAAFRIFGEHDWAARLPAALLGLGAVLMVGYTARRLWSMQAGVLAAAVVGSSWAYYLGAQYLTLDMTLTACLSLALCAFLLAQCDGMPLREQRRWMVAAWAAMACAMLGKGLIGVVLPALALTAYVLGRRDFALMRRAFPAVGIVVFLAIVLPWFVAVQIRNPDFFRFFFIYEHFERYTQAGHHRTGAWWYYLPILIAGLLPWTPALIGEAQARIKARGEHRPSGFSAEVFCLVWAGVIVVFFSLSRSKLPAYVLPAWPAIALWFAARVHDRGMVASGSFKAAALGAVLLGVAGLVALPGASEWRGFAALGEPARAHLPWLVAGSAALGLTGVCAWLVARGGRLVGAAVTLALGSFAVPGAIFVFAHGVEDRYSSARLITTATRGERPFRPEAPFYSVGQFDPTVPFYLGRTVTLVDSRGELGPGIDAEPHKVLPTVDAFSARWADDAGPAYAVMTPALFADLRARGLPMTPLARDARLVVVARISR